MLHEEEPTGKVRGSQWPPADSAIGHKPSSFFTKVSRGQGGRPVEWPPRPSQEENKQVSSSESNDAPAPPVPPRPANYPQATMDPSQQQQMVSQQQQVQQQQQQQHRQQVTSSSEMRTVKQTYHVQQHQTYQQQYQQQGHQIDGFQQQMVQQPQQQSVQYQMSQQTSSSAFHQLPAHNQHPTPAQPMPSVFQNGSPAPTQARTAPAPAPAPNPPAAAPQYANQNGTAPPHAPAPQEGTPEPASILPQYQAAPGYSTAYTAVHGEWPPKNENAPNMTTTYPSGFKLRERAPVEQAPARVVTSQPAFKMTQPIRKSGDSKWPPKGNMEPTQQEVREFIKPRKSNKDYSEFFAQNALPHNYAAYRPPPGTQHHGLLEEGVSNM